MSDEGKKLEREESAAPRRRRRRGRVVRAEGDEDTAREVRGANRRRRSDLRDEAMDLQKGVIYAGIEALAAGVDVASNAARGTVDRAFSRDYRNPGDLVRNVGRDASEVARDAMEDVRDAPRRVTDGFYEAVPNRRRADRGERHRRAQEARRTAEEETD